MFIDFAMPPLRNRAGQSSTIKRFLCATMVGICFLAEASSAQAQDEQETPPDPLDPPASSDFSAGGFFGGGTVPPSLLAPSRLQVGKFALSSQASFGLLYDDNVEADDDERDEDVFLSFSPSVRAQSTFSRHSLGFGASATTSAALKDTTDDVFDWQVGADGRIDLSRRSSINAAVGYSRDVEDDEDVDAEDDDGDTPINNIDASLGYDITGERLSIGVGGTVSRFDIEGDDFEDRDRTSVGLNGRVRYKLTDDLSFSGGPNYRRSAFDEDEADDGESRDANEFGLQAGVGYRATRTIRTRAALGYAAIAFDDSDRDDEESLTGSTGLTWAPGNGTTLSLDASRSLGLAIEDGEDSRISTRGSAALAHRLKIGFRSSLASSLALGVTRLSDLDRTDKDLVASLTYAYRLAENVSFSSSYRYSQRFSDDDDADFFRNVISLGVTVSY